jgi:hypothetical protein
MAERGTAEIRQEMEAARRRLDEARTGVRAELRSLVPFAVVGLVVVGGLTARAGVRAGVSLVRRLS